MTEVFSCTTSSVLTASKPFQGPIRWFSKLLQRPKETLDLVAFLKGVLLYSRTCIYQRSGSTKLLNKLRYLQNSSIWYAHNTMWQSIIIMVVSEQQSFCLSRCCLSKLQNKIPDKTLNTARYSRVWSRLLARHSRVWCRLSRAWCKLCTYPVCITLQRSNRGVVRIFVPSNTLAVGIILHLRSGVVCRCLTSRRTVCGFQVGNNICNPVMFL